MWLMFTLLGAVFWSASDVANSLIVQYHEDNPIVLAWFVSLLDLILLVVLFLLFDIQTTWMLILFGTGIISYFGLIAFYRMIRHIDTSVSTAAWAIMAILISIAGFILFNEVWNSLQTLGVVLVLSGVFLLSYWHTHVSIPHTLLLLFLPALFYAPFFISQKAALLAGESILSVFFWPIAGSRFMGILIPAFDSSCRQKVIVHIRNPDMHFLFLNALIFVFSTIGFYCLTRAYDLGMASLVSVAENVQPFATMIFAWLMLRTFPNFTPRELLTAQSVQVKLVSFGIVFVGLALLALG